MPPNRCNYTICSTYAAVATATALLSASKLLFLDCEARDIARPGGVLSLISISDANARTIFLIDAIVLTDRTHPSLQAFLELLAREDVTKVMWDGRSDAIELRDTYGVELHGVLDLQLTEVMSQIYLCGETDDMRLWRLARGYFRNVKQDVLLCPAKYDGIYQICRMAACLKLRGITDSKDEAVASLHKTMGSEMWVQRPLPEMLLQYAAHDIHLIAQLYYDFTGAGWITAYSFPTLRDRSARYLRTYTSCAVKQRHDKRKLSLFVPLGVLDLSSARNEPIQELELELSGQSSFWDSEQ
ncbi:ribonuclease H-like domain-containing protein [Fomes fomentarius]|nr:ribonuclease H-like domain-containing protein [Fomes fomentarius]